MKYLLMISLAINVGLFWEASGQKTAQAMERSLFYSQLQYVKEQCKALIRECNK